MGTGVQNPFVALTIMLLPEANCVEGNVIVKGPVPVPTNEIGVGGGTPFLRISYVTPTSELFIPIVISWPEQMFNGEAVVKLNIAGDGSVKVNVWFVVQMELLSETVKVYVPPLRPPTPSCDARLRGVAPFVIPLSGNPGVPLEDVHVYE